MELDGNVSVAITIISWLFVPWIMSWWLSHKTNDLAELKPNPGRKIFFCALFLQASFFVFAIVYGYLLGIIVSSGNLAWQTNVDAIKELAALFFLIPVVITQGFFCIPILFGITIFSAIAIEFIRRKYKIGNKLTYQLWICLVAIPFVVLIALSCLPLIFK